MRIFLPIIAFALFSCGTNEDADPVTPGSAAKTDTLPYYDFTTSLQVDIDNVRFSPTTFIYKLTEVNGKKDSVVIDTNEFKRLAQPFFVLQLNKPEIKKEYKETVFEDIDTKSFVFNYNTSNESLPVKSVSVMVDNQQQDFKRVDLLKAYAQNDTLFEERLAWVAGKKFQVVRLSTVGSATSKHETYVMWKEKK